MDIIIGSGISGLSYAAFSKSDYIILEKEDEIGGYCRTIHKDGFTWDYAGHFFHFSDDSIRQFVLGALDASRILNVTKRNQIQYKDKKIDYPFQKNIHQLDKEEFIDCLYDLFVNPYKDYASFKELLYVKFGKSISEKFLIPYNSKLYACDLDNLEPDAMGRFFPYANKEEIVANFRNPTGTVYNSSFLYPIDGAAEYINSVVTHIKQDSIRLSEEVLGIDLDKHEVRTQSGVLKYDRLVSTIPLPTLLELSGVSFNPDLYTSNKVLVFNIGFDKKGVEVRNHWIYYPEDKYIFYRVGFYDNIYQQNRLSIYVEIGYSNREVINIEAAYARTLEDLRLAGIITDHQVVSQCHIIMDPAYVHISKRMEEDRTRQMKFLNDCDVYSIGRYGNWTYCSIEDNVKEALHLANQLSQA